MRRNTRHQYNRAITCLVLLLIVVAWPQLASAQNVSFTNRGFVANQGQWHPDVQFMALSATGSPVWITTKGIVYDQKKYMESSETDSSNPRRQGHVVRIYFHGASSNPSVYGIDQQSGYYNYIRTSDKTKWITNVPVYGRVKFQGIYPGVDILYYYEQQNLRYDLIVAPNVNSSVIKLLVEGADSLHQASDRKIIVQTSVGAIEQQDLFVYQLNANNKPKRVQCEYTMLDRNLIGLKIGEYNTNKPLIVDPLLFSHHLFFDNRLRLGAMAVDSNNNVYIAGLTTSDNYPITSGAYDTISYSDGKFFVMSTDSEGKIRYSTFIEPLYNDTLDHYFFYTSGINDIAVNRSGKLVFACVTEDYIPLTPNAYDTSVLPGGTDHMFIVQLNHQGNDLEFSTTFDIQTAWFYPINIGYDASDNIWISGETYRAIPLTEDAIDTVIGSRSFNSRCFISKFSPDGSKLLYSTFFGGTIEEKLSKMVVANDGSIYITGKTRSSDFPTTDNVYDRTINDTLDIGVYDIFVIKFDASGKKILASTFIGTKNQNDQVFDMEIGSNGDVYLLALPNQDFPITSFITPDTLSANWRYRRVVMKLPSDLSRIEYSATLGGGVYIVDEALNNKGEVYCVGAVYRGGRDNYPTTSDAIQKEFQGGNWDGFLKTINASGTEALYSSYLGSLKNDSVKKIVVSRNGDLYLLATTYGTNFPATSSPAWDTLPSSKHSAVVLLRLQLSAHSDAQVVPITGRSSMLSAEIAPNPAQDYIHLQVLLHRPTYLTVTIYTADGRLIDRPIINKSVQAGYYSEEITTSDLASGTYILKTITEDSSTEQLVVIAR